MKMSKIIHFYEFTTDVYINIDTPSSVSFTSRNTGFLYEKAGWIGLQINEGEFVMPKSDPGMIRLIKSMLLDDFLAELKKR